jgi:hypothetical protein
VISSQKQRITYDSEGENKFIMHRPDGSQREFIESDKGLFYSVMTGSSGTGTALVNTVADNKSKYTQRDYKRALLARKIQNVLGRPSTRRFIEVVNGNLLKNCPINADDIRAAEDILGPNLGSLKGKTVRKGGQHIDGTHAQVPREIMELHRDVTLCVDIMFVNKIPFLVTISRNIKFGTVEILPNRKAKSILQGVARVQKVYKRRGFRVVLGMMDNEFEPLRAGFMDLGMELNVTSRGEHVPEIERYIRTIKERTRSIYNVLPYKKMPSKMVVEMVQGSVFWLNIFPSTDGVSDTMSPRLIVAGFELDYDKHCQLEFGAYAQVHEEHDNSMATRTTGAIALRPTGNAQGGYYFLSLSSGRRLNRNHWTELPMPQEVITRVHDLARQDRGNPELIFADRRGDTVTDDDSGCDDDDDDDDDSDYDPDDYVDNRNEESDEEEFEVDDSDEDDDDTADVPAAGVLRAGVPDTRPDRRVRFEAATPTPAAAQVDTTVDEEDADEDAANNAPVPAAQEVETVDEEEEADKDDDEASTTHNLRPRRTREYGHLYPRSDFEHTHSTLTETCMTQYSVKKGLKEFGEAGAEAVVAEMRQLHDRKVIEPVKAGMLTTKEKRGALQYLMFLKKKRCGRIKGRGCADGRKQRMYKSKEETSSPTVAIESLMLSCTIDAKERRQVITCDIPGAFMQSDMDELIYMKVEGPLAEMLTKVDPSKYEKFTDEENGKPVIYVRLRKALYGTLQASLLFWKDLTGHLTKWGYVANPYDECVMNKEVNGTQCTVLWHVDDIKMSHVEGSVLEELVDKLEEVYGSKEAPVTVTRGKIHEYLGMTLDYSDDGKCKVIMKDFIADMLDDLPSDMDGESVTPAANHLFQVNEDPKKLNEETSQMFHHNTAKLLFLSKRARPDIQTAVAYMTTRVKSPDMDDYKKLTRVMRYLRGTINLFLTLEADDLSVVKWWVDGSFAVHADMKSHTGATMSLGKGSPYSTSTRQKLNTKSSTEAELVAVDDTMPQALWTTYFLKAQGYDVGKTIVYQDNQSAMLLEKNGRRSSGKRTRHVNIRYFFVTDRVKAGEVDIQYCPTGEMRGDFFTKPLQGIAFRRFRELVLNMRE